MMMALVRLAASGINSGGSQTLQ